MENKNIGDCLRWLRHNRGLTQRDCAEQLEINYRHYQNIETGKAEIKLSTLHSICSYYQLDLYQFFKCINEEPWNKQN